MVWGNEKPINIKIKEIQDDFMRKFIKQKVVQNMHQMKMPAYLCEQCQKNYWTYKVLIGKNLHEHKNFNVCDLCNAHIRETCRRFSLRYQVLVMRRTDENSRELDKRLIE